MLHVWATDDAQHAQTTLDALPRLGNPLNRCMYGWVRTMALASPPRVVIDVGH